MGESYLQELPPIVTGWPEPDDDVWIWTSRYQNKAIAETNLVPCRTSRGGPRFKLAYEIEAYIPEITPSREEFGIRGSTAFRSAYMGRLATIGIERITDILGDVSEAHGGRKLVLLCFEDVLGTKDYCHRRAFADWFERETGIVVPELLTVQPKDVIEQVALL